MAEAGLIMQLALIMEARTTTEEVICLLLNGL